MQRELDGPEAQAAVQICWQWGAGGGVPPFDPESEAAQQLMLDLVSGSVPVPSGVTVTKAVAIQIYLLFQEGRLRHLAWKDMFFVIASLSLGYAAAAPSDAAVMRLRRALYFKSDRTYLGLVADYRERMKKRSRDEMLKQLDQAEAQRHSR